MKQTRGYLLLICIVSAMGGLLFGYDWVVIGGAKIFYEPFFGIENSAALRGWAMSSALIGCLAGALLSGIWSDKYGRKKMLVIASFLFALSAWGTGAVDHFSYFIFYRIVGGLGIGIASNISPVYIAEVSPAHVRGKFVSLNQLTIVLGILLAQLANWQIGEYYTQGSDILSETSVQWAWRWMFWAELIPAGIFFLLSFIIPESPRWLATVHQQEKAQKTLTRIGGETYARQTLEELNQLTQSQGNRQNNEWKSVFRPEMCKVLIIGIVLAIFQQWCGINVIFNYAHEIFSSAGYAVSDVLMNIVVTGITNVIFTFVAIYTVDKWGRRYTDADRFGRISADLPYIGNLLLSGCKRFTHASTGGTCHRLLCYVTCPGSLGGVIRNLPRENTRYGYSHLYFLPLGGLFHTDLYLPGIE